MKYFVQILMMFFVLSPLYGQYAAADEDCWKPVGGGFSQTCLFAEEFNDQLYVINYMGDGEPREMQPYALLKWNGKRWTSVSNFMLDRQIYCMLAYKGSLYVGGTFTTIGDATDCHGIARWDGMRWHAAGKGNLYDSAVFSAIYDMAEFNDDLYCAGSFVDADTNIISPVIRMSNEEWTMPGNVPGDWINEYMGPYSSVLKVFQGELYMGGRFNMGEMRSLARWDGHLWSGVPGLNEMLHEEYTFYPSEMAVYNDELYLYGRDTASRFMRWNGKEWLNVESGAAYMYSEDIDMEVYDGSLYITQNNAEGSLVRWDGHNMSFAADFDGWLSDLAVYRNRLYAAGRFTVRIDKPTAGLNNIAAICENVVLSVPDESINNPVAIAPNPVHGSMKIDADMLPGTRVLVQDMLGRTLMEQEFRGGEMLVDVSPLPAGRYFVKIPARGGEVIRQVNVVK